MPSRSKSVNAKRAFPRRIRSCPPPPDAVALHRLAKLIVRFAGLSAADQDRCLNLSGVDAEQLRNDLARVAARPPAAQDTPRWIQRLAVVPNSPATWPAKRRVRAQSIVTAAAMLSFAAIPEERQASVIRQVGAIHLAMPQAVCDAVEMAMSVCGDVEGIAADYQFYTADNRKRDAAMFK